MAPTIQHIITHSGGLVEKRSHQRCIYQHQAAAWPAQLMFEVSVHPSPLQPTHIETWFTNPYTHKGLVGKMENEGLGLRVV